MEKGKNSLTNNHLKKTKREKEKKKTFRNEIWNSDDDVLPQAISAATHWWRAWCCLDMSASCYTVSLFGLCTLSGMDYRTLLRGESKHQAELRGLCPMQSLCGQRWKAIPHTQNQQRFCCCPSCGQKSEKQECVEGLVMAELETDLSA